MPRFTALISWAIIVGLGLVAEAGAQDLVITNARILDGNGGMIERGAVTIRGGRIAAVGENAAPAPGAMTIDAGGMTVMPGFIDAHRHMIGGDPAAWMREEAGVRMREFLEAGFTTVLSAGDDLDTILELRRRLETGEIAGPRMIVSGRVPLARAAGGGGGGPRVDPARLDPARPPNRPTETGVAIPEEETRAAVRRLREAGVDAIKTGILLTPDGPEEETLSVVADEAERQGLLSITHATSVGDTVAAVRAGTHVLVHTPHIGHLDEPTTRMIAESGIPMMSTLGVFVPTFAEDNALVRAEFGEDNLARFRDLDVYPMRSLASAGQGPVNARLLWEAGITYGYGTDTRFLPADALAHELKPLELVFSRKDIVTILTRNAAVTIGRGDQLGTLEAGKLADIVILDGNPIEDTSALLNVEVVIKEGNVVVDKR